MVADVALVAEQQQVLLGGLAAALADGAVEAAPALLEHGARDVGDVGAVRVEALAALGAGQHRLGVAERAAGQAHVLLQHEAVVAATDDHGARVVVLLLARLRLRLPRRLIKKKKPQEKNN